MGLIIIYIFIRSYAAAINEADGSTTCRSDGCAADGVTCTDASGNPNDPCLPDGKLIEIEVFEQHECKVDNPTQKALKRVDLENDEFFMNCPNIEITAVDRPDSPVTPESIGFDGKGIQLNAERRDYILKVWINNKKNFRFFLKLHFDPFQFFRNLVRANLFPRFSGCP